MSEAPELAPGVRGWDGSASSLPPGMAGLAVRMGSAEERLPGCDGPIVGVDGRTVLRGWGEAFLLLSPGVRLVDVTYVRPRKEERLTLVEGEVARFAYEADNAALVEAGSLAAAASRGRARPREKGMNLTLLVLIVCVIGFGTLGGLVDGIPPPVTVGAMVIGSVAGAVGTQVWWRRHLRRHGIDYWSLAPYASWREHEARRRSG